MNFRNNFAWIYKRFFMGYGFLSSFMAVFNFVGIFTLLLQNYIPISPIILMVGMAIFGIVFLVTIAIIIYDVLGMRTYFTEKEQAVDKYWHSKLNPLQKKQLMLTLEALENPGNINDLKQKVKSGYL